MAPASSRELLIGYARSALTGALPRLYSFPMSAGSAPAAGSVQNRVVIGSTSIGRATFLSPGMVTISGLANKGETWRQSVLTGESRHQVHDPGEVPAVIACRLRHVSDSFFLRLGEFFRFARHIDYRRLRWCAREVRPRISADRAPLGVGTVTRRRAHQSSLIVTLCPQPGALLHDTIRSRQPTLRMLASATFDSLTAKRLAGPISMGT